MHGGGGRNKERINERRNSQARFVIGKVWKQPAGDSLTVSAALGLVMCSFHLARRPAVLSLLPTAYGIQAWEQPRRPSSAQVTYLHTSEPRLNSCWSLHTNGLWFLAPEYMHGQTHKISPNSILWPCCLGLGISRHLALEIPHSPHRGVGEDKNQLIPKEGGLKQRENL